MSPAAHSAIHSEKNAATYCRGAVDDEEEADFRAAYTPVERGGSREAARLSGINVDRMIVVTYMVAGFLSALAGLVELSRLSSGQPSAGDGFEMNVITAVVLGGISVNGGEGKFSGVVVGIFIMSVLANGLVMMNVYEFYQQLIRGIVLIFAVGFDQLSKRRKSVKKVKAA